MDSTLIGRLLLVLGLLATAAGLWLMTGHKLPFGSLPGDLTFGGGNVSVSIPLVSGLILSIILTVVLNIVLRR